MYEGVDAAVLRVSLWPREQLVPAGPGVIDEGIDWTAWLRRVWDIPGFADAVAHASPALARQVEAIFAGASTPGQTVKAGQAVLRYLLRAGTRATPFGLFAGVAAAHISDTGTPRIGKDHRATARIPPVLARAVYEDIITRPEIWPHLLVQANDLVTERAGFLVLPQQASRPPGGAPGDVVVRATTAVRAILAAATAPVLTIDLAAKVAEELGADAHRVDGLLVGLVKHRLLLTHLDPVMTDTEPLAAITTAAEALGADAGSRTPVSSARSVISAKTAFDNSSPATRAARLRDLTTATAVLHPGPAGIGIDVAADADLPVPQILVQEAANAATVLTRLAQGPPARWRQWHEAFVERFGLDAIVPVGDAIDPDIGLGYPAGYGDITGQTPQGPLTGRDTALLALAGQAGLTRTREVVLSDTDIHALADPGQVTAGASTEILARIDATSMDAIKAGDFTLTMRGVFTGAGSGTGRFLDLFDAPARQRMTAAYRALPAHTEDAIRAQITGPGPHTTTEAVARAPQIWPHLIPLGEPGAARTGTIGLDDLAVTAGSDRVWLVSLSHRRVVEPVLPNAVSRALLHPLARFLTEISTAFTQACSVFEWGQAAEALPFLPALRHGRSILSEARWLLHPSQLPGPGTPEHEWHQSLREWMAATGCPERVELGSADQRIALDLSQAAHRGLLRARLRSDRPARLTAAADPVGDGWIGGRAHELLIPLAATTPPHHAPRISGEPLHIRSHGHLPGDDPGRIYLKVYAHPDRHNQILTRLTPLLTELGEQGCWWLRYRDPAPHLRIRFTQHTAPADAALAAIAAWARGLRAAGLTTRIVYDTDFPETMRFGGPGAYTAVEDVFIADSGLTLALLDTTTAAPGLDIRAVTAAGFVDLATAAFTDPAEAMAWLVGHYSNRPEPPARAVYDQACRLAASLIEAGATPVHVQAIESWRTRRSSALRSYLRTAINLDLDTVLGDLLHLNHARMIGPDRDSEARCGHLARAAALSILARRERHQQ